MLQNMDRERCIASQETRAGQVALLQAIQENTNADFVLKKLEGEILTRVADWIALLIDNHCLQSEGAQELAREAFDRYKADTTSHGYGVLHRKVQDVLGWIRIRVPKALVENAGKITKEEYNLLGTMYRETVGGLNELKKAHNTLSTEHKKLSKALDKVNKNLEKADSVVKASIEASKELLSKQLSSLTPRITDLDKKIADQKSRVQEITRKRKRPEDNQGAKRHRLEEPDHDPADPDYDPKQDEEQAKEDELEGN